LLILQQNTAQIYTICLIRSDHFRIQRTSMLKSTNFWRLWTAFKISL